MEYITHHRFKGLGACGERLNLPYGTVLQMDGSGFLVTQDGKRVCFPSSENAHIHFARNDDGHGLQRGALTYAVAYSSRDAGDGFRFSEKEREMLAQSWSHFLRPDSEYILFNQKFFEADVGELRTLMSALNIKVRR